MRIFLDFGHKRNERMAQEQRQQYNTMNKDEGVYKLDHICDQLIYQQSTKVSSTSVTKIAEKN